MVIGWECRPRPPPPPEDALPVLWADTVRDMRGRSKRCADWWATRLTWAKPASNVLDSCMELSVSLSWSLSSCSLSDPLEGDNTTCVSEVVLWREKEKTRERETDRTRERDRQRERVRKGHDLGGSRTEGTHAEVRAVSPSRLTVLRQEQCV